jgi:hypothetical protein
MVQVIDNAVSSQELALWQARVKTGTQSTGLTEAAVQETELYALAKQYAPGMKLIHCLLFEIVQGHRTELHQDIGEFAVLFYPYDAPTAPLRTLQDGVLVDIPVRANRMVVLNCTLVAHQQIVPEDDSSRCSVAFKFRLPEAPA